MRNPQYYNKLLKTSWVLYGIFSTVIKVLQYWFWNLVQGYILVAELMNWHQAAEIMSPETAPLILGPVGPTIQLFSFSGNPEALINGLYFWVVLLQLMSLIKWYIVTQGHKRIPQQRH